MTNIRHDSIIPVAVRAHLVAGPNGTVVLDPELSVVCSTHMLLTPYDHLYNILTPYYHLYSTTLKPY